MKYLASILFFVAAVIFLFQIDVNAPISWNTAATIILLLASIVSFYVVRKKL